MKCLLHVCFFLILSVSFSQTGTGGLRVLGYRNKTANLLDNQEIKSMTVRIISEIPILDTIIIFSAKNKNRCGLKKGLYQLIINTEGESELVLYDVRISPDRLTFIDILYEPASKLNYFERKKRRKAFANMRDL